MYNACIIIVHGGYICWFCMMVDVFEALVERGLASLVYPRLCMPLSDLLALYYIIFSVVITVGSTAFVYLRNYTSLDSLSTYSI